MSKGFWISTKKFALLSVFIGGFVCVQIGCVTENYQYGTEFLSSVPLKNSERLDVSYGDRRPFLDRVEKFVQHPIQTIGHRLNMSEPVPEPNEENDPYRKESVDLVKKYLNENGLGDIKVEVRTYEPNRQWERLVQNDKVSPVWKYTGGTVSWLQYKLVPMRPMHEDRYDPYTDTLHINSNDPIGALYEAAIAKKYHQKKFPGAHAMLQWAPFYPVYHHTEAANEALSYAAKQENFQTLLKKLYPYSYGKIGGSAISSTISSVPKLNNQPFPLPNIAETAGEAVSRKTGELVGNSWGVKEEKQSESVDR